MYALSNRQLKSLLVRKTPLQITLPMPVTPPADLLAYARKVITGVDPRYIVAATEEEVLAQLPASGDMGLASIYGQLVAAPSPSLPEPLIVIVIVVRLDVPGSRHKPDPLAWPATHVDRTGSKWPRSPETEHDSTDRHP